MQARHSLRLLLLVASLASACSDDSASETRPSQPADMDEDDPAGEDDDAPGRELDAGRTMDARMPAAPARDGGSESRDDAGDPLGSDASGSDAATPPARAQPMIEAPVVRGPIAGKPLTTSTGQISDLASYGYVEQELFIEGTANGYVSKGERGLDGKWAAERAAEAPYVTRLVVRRPVRASDFNGTAVVEWLNVTGSMDTEILFPFAWEELLRGGYAYVGVTVQKVGSDNLKVADAARYADLVHPGDTFAYDIFAQAGVAVGWPTGQAPLGELEVERVIAYGESQSAMRMITYVNAVHPLTRAFDGFFIHSRAGWGAAVGDESDALLGDGTPVQVRADLGSPVLQFFTESEVVLALGPAHLARQPDSDTLRTWEVAGTAHADTRLLGKGTDLACGGATVNDGPQHLVVKAGLRALHRWLGERVAPAHGAPIELAPDDTIARDEHGNALGGVRTPAVDVPIATHTGIPLNGNPACMLFGASAPFPADKLRALYPTHEDYVSKVEASARDARERGFILPEEETTLLAEAAAAAVP